MKQNMLIDFDAQAMTQKSVAAPVHESSGKRSRKYQETSRNAFQSIPQDSLDALILEALLKEQAKTD